MYRYLLFKIGDNIGGLVTISAKFIEFIEFLVTISAILVTISDVLVTISVNLGDNIGHLVTISAPNLK